MNKEDFNRIFDTAFKDKKGTDFDDWFADMAQYVWGDDFEKIKSGGRSGDKKSDGRRISSDIIYQCYAPESPQNFASTAPTKIADSFPDVTKYWPNLKKWIFIHNNKGITTNVSDTLEGLRAEYPNIEISQVSRTFLKDQLHNKLAVQQLLDVYPESATFFKSTVTYDDIRPLLKNIIKNAKPVPNTPDLGQIPNEDKLNCNNLSDFDKREIRQGLMQARLVDKFLETRADPTVNHTLKTEISHEYKRLRGLGHESEEIVKNILIFIGNDGTTQVRSASMVIFSYYFDACEIFENS